MTRGFQQALSSVPIAAHEPSARLETGVILAQDSTAKFSKDMGLYMRDDIML